MRGFCNFSIYFGIYRVFCNQLPFGSFYTGIRKENFQKTSSCERLWKLSDISCYLVGPETLNYDMPKRNNPPSKHSSRMKSILKRFDTFGTLFGFDLGENDKLVSVFQKFRKRSFRSSVLTSFERCFWQFFYQFHRFGRVPSNKVFSNSFFFESPKNGSKNWGFVFCFRRFSVMLLGGSWNKQFGRALMQKPVTKSKLLHKENHKTFHTLCLVLRYALVTKKSMVGFFSRYWDG